jgi:hypothetical protein
MCAAVVAWVVTFRLAMNPVTSMPHFRSGMTSAETQDFEKRLDDAMAKPGQMVMWMLVGQGVSGVLFLAGLVVTGMGLVEYSAELRAAARD